MAAQLRFTGSFRISKKSKPNVATIPAATLSDLRNIRRRLGAFTENVSSLVVTITNEPGKAVENLCTPECPHPTVVLRTNPDWPGNLYKLRAFAAISGAVPKNTVVLLTDCCDVLVRPKHDVFDSFHHESQPNASLSGSDIVVAATRGWSMLAGSSHASKSDYQKHNRLRVHDHNSSEFPQNPIQTALNVPDECNSSTQICTQSKFANAGTVLGRAASLHRFYNNIWSRCTRCQEWERSSGMMHDLLKNTSEQNEFLDYLLLSKFCDGRCKIDFGMVLFHVTTGFSKDDYCPGQSAGEINVRLPGSQKCSFPLQAGIIHASGGLEKTRLLMRSIIQMVDPTRPDTFWSPPQTL